MLLFHSEMNFNPEDTVYAIWIKNDMLFSYKLEGNTLYFINEMKIEDDFTSNEKYEYLLDPESPPKFLVIGAYSSDSRLKKLRSRFKASKTKMLRCTYEDCLKKSASHYLSRFIRAKDWRWNFKLSNSTVPETYGHHKIPRKRKTNKALVIKTMIACILLAMVFALFSSNSPIRLTGRSYYSDITKISKHDEEIYGYIIGEGNDIRLTIYGAQTKQAIGIINKKRELFIIDFQSIFEHPKFKAIVIQIDSVSHHVEFYKMIKAELLSLNIPYSFVNDDTFMYASILMASEVNVDIGEYVIMALFNDESYIRVELQYTDVGYIGIEKKDVPGSLDLKKTTAAVIRHNIIGTNNPSKIILHANYLELASTKLLKDVILREDSDIVITLEESFGNYEAKFLFEKVKWMFDKSYTKFHIPPLSHRRYMIGFKCGHKEYPLIVCEKNEVLPFKKTLVIPRTPFEYFLGSTNLYNYGLVNHGPINSKFLKAAHIHILSLEVDVDNFLNTSSTTGGYLAFPHLVGTLNEILPSKIPVIAIYGDLSFIFIYNQGLGYNVLSNWNGVYGRELYVSFDEKQYKLFGNAVKVLRSTCSSVAHDIIKVLSYSPEDIPLSTPTYGYNITKDCKNQIWFRVNTFNGIKKASPTFLMSLLLKRHIKAIQQKLGEKPNEIAFSLFEEFDKSAENRIQNGLKESCKLVGIECSFVESLPMKFISL